MQGFIHQLFSKVVFETRLNNSKKDLLIYNYLYYHYNMDAYENTARKIDLKSIDFTTSKGLEKFVGLYETHI